MFQTRKIVPAATKPVLVRENSPTMGAPKNAANATNVKAMADAYKASVVAAAAKPATNDGAVAVAMATEANASVRDLRMRFERRQGPSDARQPAVAQSPRVGRLSMNRFGRFGVVAAPENEHQQVSETHGGAALNNENNMVVEEEEKTADVAVVEEEEENKSEEELTTEVVDGEEDAKFAAANLLVTEDLLVEENLLVAEKLLAPDNLLAVVVELEEHKEEKVLVVANKAEEEEAERVVVGDKENVKDEKAANIKDKMLVVGETNTIRFAYFVPRPRVVTRRRDRVEVFKQKEGEEKQQENEDAGNDLFVLDSTSADDEEEEEELAILEDNGLWEDVDEIVTPATRLQGAVATAKDVVLALGEYAQAAIDWIISESTAAIQYLTSRTPAQDGSNESVTECDIAISMVKEKEDEDDDDAWGVNPVYGFFV